MPGYGQSAVYWCQLEQRTGIGIALDQLGLGVVFSARSDGVTEAFFGRFCTSVAVQTEYIQRHLSAFSSANNHLIGEAAGLAITGMAFPILPNAATWRDCGLRILEAELPWQIYPDSVSATESCLSRFCTRFQPGQLAVGNIKRHPATGNLAQTPVCRL